MVALATVAAVGLTAAGTAGAGAFARGAGAVAVAEGARPSPAGTAADGGAVAAVGAAAARDGNGGEIASFHRRVEERLDAARPPTRPAGWVRVRVEDVVWLDASGDPVLLAAELRGAVDADALGAGDVVARDVVITDPVLTLRQAAAGAAWNVAGAYARLTGRAGAGPAPDPDAGAGAVPTGPDAGADDPMLVRIEGATVTGGELRLETPALRAMLGDVTATVDRILVGDPASPAASIAWTSVTGTLSVPREDLRKEVALADGAVRFPDGEVAFELEALRAGDSRVEAVAGRWRPGAAGPGLDVRARASPLRFADLRPFVAGLPAGGEAAFAVELATNAAGRTLVDVSGLLATAPDPPSRVRGAARFAVGGPGGLEVLSADLELDPLDLAFLEPFTGELPYGGVLVGRVAGAAAAIDVDVGARLTAPGLARPFEVGVTGSLAFEDREARIRALRAELRDVPLAALGPLLPFPPPAGRVAGTVEVAGPPARAPLELNVRLTLAEGAADVAGTLDLTGDVPAYELAGSVSGVRLQELVAGNAPPVALSAEFTLAGRGLDPATAEARATLDGRFAGWFAGPGDGVTARAAIAGGVVAVDTAALALATLSASAAGTWGVAGGAPAGAIAYTAGVGDLGPWAPYLPIGRAEGARGRAATAGTLTRAPSGPRLAGNAAVRGVAVGDWSVASGEAEYAVAFGAPLPAFRIVAGASDVVAGPLGALDTVAFRLVREPPAFALEVVARREGGAAVIVQAEGSVAPDGTHAATLHALELRTPAGDRWSLARPAELRFTRAPDALEIRRFVVEQVDAPGRIAIDGRVAREGPVALELAVRAIPVDPLLALSGVPPRLRGYLDADAEIGGTADRPVAAAAFEVRNGQVDGLAYHSIEGRVEYSSERLLATAAALVDGGGPLEIAADFPLDLTLGLPPSASLLDDRPLRAALLAEAVPLHVLKGSVSGVRDVEGILDASATVTGTARSPRLEGRIAVLGGALTVRSFERRYEGIHAEAVLEGQTLTIVDARARSDGWLRASGEIRFQTLADPEVELALDFDGFRPFGYADGDDAALRGHVEVVGPAEAPVITGDLRLDDGDLVVSRLFGDGPGPGGAGDDLPGLADVPDLPDPDAVAATPPWIERVTVDSLVVRAGNDLWVVTDELRVQLSGEIAVFMAAGEPRLYGTLEGDRGTFTLEVGPIVRRFNVVDASVRFTGQSPPDPIVDVTASWIAPGADGERREIVARIQGTLSAPSLALGTADGVQIPETELLSFILFGRPTFELGEGILPGAAVFEQLFVGGLTQLATLQLEEAVLRDIGLPLYQFEIRTGVGGAPWLTAPIFVFGIRVAEDLYLTVESGFGMLFGGTGVLTDDWAIVLEWQIDPEWTALLGYEPLRAVRLFRPTSAPVPTTVPERQFIAEIRRRWTY